MRKVQPTELVILGIQLLIFYAGPSFFLKIDPLGTLLGLVSLTFLLALLMGLLSRSKWKWLYPAVTVGGFIPSVYMFYQPDSLINAWWYLVVSVLGLLLGSMIYGFLKKN